MTNMEWLDQSEWETNEILEGSICRGKGIWKAPMDHGYMQNWWNKTKNNTTTRNTEGDGWFESTREIARYSKRMIQKFDICRNLAIYMPWGVCGGSIILFRQVCSPVGRIRKEMEGEVRSFIFGYGNCGSFSIGLRWLWRLGGEGYGQFGAC